MFDFIDAMLRGGREREALAGDGWFELVYLFTKSEVNLMRNRRANDDRSWIGELNG